MYNPEPVYILHCAKQLQHNLARSALREDISRNQVLEELSTTRKLHNEVISIESRIGVLKLKYVGVTHFL